MSNLGAQKTCQRFSVPVLVHWAYHPAAAKNILSMSLQMEVYKSSAKLSTLDSGSRYISFQLPRCRVLFLLQTLPLQIKPTAPSVYIEMKLVVSLSPAFLVPAIYALPSPDP